MYDRWLTDFYLLILIFLCSIFLLKNWTSFMFSVESAPFFFCFIFCFFWWFYSNTYVAFCQYWFYIFCYFSVLFLPWMTAISFYLAILPFYLFIFPLLFFLPIFPFSSIIMISVHLAPASLYAGNFFTSYWFLRFSCSVFSMISMTIFILTHSKGKR